jgi:glycosyltransferase involved in cell wall biosynthesis
MLVRDDKKLKLLLIAHGCDEKAVGEAWSSFQWVSRLGQRHDVTLLTYRYSYKPPTAQQLPGVRVIEWFDAFPIFEKWVKFNAMLKPSYVAFYIQARRWLRNQLKEGENFDLVHQLSPLALRYPCPAIGLGLPLVVGPLGGSIEDPPAFRSELVGVPWYTKLRSLDRWRLRHDPLLRRSYAHADQLICVAPYVKDVLGDLPSNEVALMSETGIVQLPPQRLSARVSARELRLLFVGRVIRSKGVRDAIRAIAKLKDMKGLKFDVVGDGDDLVACKEETLKLGVNETVLFHGRLARGEVDQFYASADVFLFPSFREPSGNAVIEAMSHGLALIVADRGGPGFVVDDSCGLRIPVTEPAQFSSQIAAAIRELLLDPDLVARMGVAAREKVSHQFLWDVKIRLLEEIYGGVLTKSI